MSTIRRFTQKFAEKIVSVLNCHDRVIFRGYLPFFTDARLNSFVDAGLRMRRKDFVPFLEDCSEQLVQHAKSLAGDHYRFLQGDHDKEKIVRQKIHERNISEGLVTVLCCMETCRGVKLQYADKRPKLVFRRRPQRVLYYYFLDSDLGLIYIRVQTFFPFTVQVYVNGHDWLARQMAKCRLGFVQNDNAFTQLDDPAAAQRLADRFPHLPWVKILDRFARLVNPLLRRKWLRPYSYYWVIDQAEFSTDVLFRRREDLQALFPRLVDHTLQHFSADDILTFLGRRLHPRFDGEVLTLCRKDRRGEHRLNGFRNRDILNALYPQSTRSAEERRRRMHRVSRQFQLLRAHGLIAKIPRSHRYNITQNGEAIMSAAVRICTKEFPKEIPCAA